MNLTNVDPAFWEGKSVFLTGHTGFKGSWMSLWLKKMGANVSGYSLPPRTTPNLYDVAHIESIIDRSYMSDIRDFDALQKAIKEVRPNIVMHLAAQPLVRYSYANPIETYSVNIMGTVNLLEATRSIDGICATVVVTTDKCYENKEWLWGYRENEPLGGYDPYSSSKGCAELVTAAYRQSFFSDSKSMNKIATARAGNVIGGGDWSEDRLVPDAIKAFESNKTLMIRNPSATRPWQHVLEPLAGYLLLAQALFQHGTPFASAWNFGPNNEGNLTVSALADLLVSGWGDSANWKGECQEYLHEANFLKLDCSKAISKLNWRPRWNMDITVKKTVEWQKAFLAKENMQSVSLGQIDEYESGDT